MSWLVTGGAGLHRLARGAGVRGGRSRRGRGRRPLQRAPRVRARERALRGGHHRRHRPGRGTLREHDVEGVVHLAGFKYAGVSVDRPLHTYTQNVTGTVSLLEAMERTGVDKHGVLLERRHLRHPRRRRGHRGDRRPPGVAVRREQADRRVADPRPGPAPPGCGTPRCATSTSSARAATTSTTPARTTCSRSSSTRSLEGRTPADQRRRLPDTPTAPVCATTSTSPTSRVAHVVRRAALSRGRRTLEPVYNLGSGTGCSVAADHGRRSATVHRDRLHARDPRRAARATRPASWPRGELAARDLDWAMRHDLEDMVRSAWQARSSAVTGHDGRMTAITDLFSLDGKVAIVTGASSGLGVAFAQGLAEAGADVALGARRVDRLADTAALVERGPPGAGGRRPTSPIPQACQALVDAAMAAFGRVDVLVNNAGVGTAVPATRETPEQFRQVIDVNLNGCYWMAQACGRVMQPGSSIINISSRARHHHRRTPAGGVRRVEGRPDRAHPRPRAAVDRPQGHPRQRDRAGLLHLGDDRPVPARLPREPAAPDPGRAARATRASWPRPWCSSPPTPPATSPARRCPSTAG